MTASANVIFELTSKSLEAQRIQSTSAAHKLINFLYWQEFVPDSFDMLPMRVLFCMYHMSLIHVYLDNGQTQ